jgi:hypothetical protein
LREDGVAAADSGAFEAVEQQHLAAGLRGDLGDASPHRAGSDDSYIGKLHSHLIIVSR